MFDLEVVSRSFELSVSTRPFGEVVALSLDDEELDSSFLVSSPPGGGSNTGGFTHPPLEGLLMGLPVGSCATRRARFFSGGVSGEDGVLLLAPVFLILFSSIAGKSAGFLTELLEALLRIRSSVLFGVDATPRTLLLFGAAARGGFASLDRLPGMENQTRKLLERFS